MAKPRPSPINSDSASQPFTVPFIHRLHFTDTIFGKDRDLLLELCEPSGDAIPRVQFWLDEDVAAAESTLERRVRSFIAWAGSYIEPAGIFTCPGGEAVKNDWRHVDRMLEMIDRHQLDRRSYIVVIGGGAVLDAVGFAAATAHRGVRLIRLPTTTLAQADSGVGVKNAVNRFGKKNWLGTFAVPWAVVNDTSLLSTLPDVHFRAGFSEAVKVTALKSRSAFEQLVLDASKIRMREENASRRAIRVSAELHLAHITKGGDPFESLEARPLDFGHWSAHRMEALSGFTLAHGVAVGIGVALDTIYSSLVCGLPKKDCEQILSTLSTLGLDLDHPLLDSHEDLFAGLEEFRQHLGGRLTLTMLRGIGTPVEVNEIDYALMVKAITQLRNRSARRISRAA